MTAFLPDPAALASGPTTLPISLVVLTYNEANNIARCLDSVPFAAEKLVVDCGSTDATVAIARAHGARVVHQPWLGFGAQRNAAAALAQHDWLLVLDADEFLSPELVAECRERVPAWLGGALAAVGLRRHGLFMAAPMRHYRPLRGERKLRLYHRGRARWTEARVHETLRARGPTAMLDAPLHHRTTPSLLHKQMKSILYAELKATDRHAAGKRPWIALSPLIFIATFLKEYLLRLAVLDGARGYISAHLSANAAVYRRFRLYEMQRNPASIAQARDWLIAHDLERDA